MLESFYELDRPTVPGLVRAVLAFEPMRVIDVDLLLRTVEIYEIDRLDFAEAYLVANAEQTGIGTVASCDRSIARVRTVRRIPATGLVSNLQGARGPVTPGASSVRSSP